LKKKEGKVFFWVEGSLVPPERETKHITRGKKEKPFQSNSVNRKEKKGRKNRQMRLGGQGKKEEKKGRRGALQKSVGKNPIGAIGERGASFLASIRAWEKRGKRRGARKNSLSPCLIEERSLKIGTNDK